MKELCILEFAILPFQWYNVAANMHSVSSRWWFSEIFPVLTTGIYLYTWQSLPSLTHSILFLFLYVYLHIAAA